MKGQKKEYWQDKASNIVIIAGVVIALLISLNFNSNIRNNYSYNPNKKSSKNQSQSHSHSQELSRTFEDDVWSVSLTYSVDNFSYQGYNKKTGDSIVLRNPTISGSDNRKIYTWEKGNYRYQVAWQPQDKNYIRLLVYDPSNQVILNRLLEHKILRR